jgi:hygromycin-B 4-O-kinase
VPVDGDQAAAFLAEHFDGGATDVVPLAGGEWSAAFGFRHDGTDRVIRFGAHRADYECDRVAGRYAGPALPVPAVLEIGDAYGGAYAISERVFGRPLDDLSEREFEAALPSLLATLDAMRAADTSPTTGYGGWDANGNGRYGSWAAALLAVGADDDPSQRTSGWRARLDAMPDPAAAFTTGLAFVRAAAPELSPGRHLVHADFVNRNVLVADDTVTGMLDWGCAMYGDVLYDVANLCFAHRWFPAWGAVDIRGAARAHFAAADFDRRVQCYEVHVGLGTIAYNAFTGRTADVELATAATRAVLERNPA